MRAPQNSPPVPNVPMAPTAADAGPSGHSELRHPGAGRPMRTVCPREGHGPPKSSLPSPGHGAHSLAAQCLLCMTQGAHHGAQPPLCGV